MSDVNEEDEDKGFSFIAKEAGNLGSEWKRIQWITKNLNINSDSPIFNGQSLLLQTDGVLALLVEDFYFTIADVDSSIMQFGINPIITAMTTHAPGVVGGPGSGKTPLARILALCASRYWRRQMNITSPASYREASECDFFRGQPDPQGQT